MRRSGQDRAAAPAPLRRAADAQECAHAAVAARLTPSRTRVLDILRRARRALGAYEIIDAAARESGRPVAPITVYRALDHLRQAGLVHRLESRNAFLACDHGHGHSAREATVFLICDSCGAVGEEGSAPLESELAAIAGRAGFAAMSESIEIVGRCAACAEPS